MTVGLTTCPFMTASHKTKIGYQVKNLRMIAFGTKQTFDFLTIVAKIIKLENNIFTRRFVSIAGAL